MRSLSIFFTLFLLLFSIPGKSQSISKYLDDGIKGTPRNIISVGYDPIYTMFPVKYERQVIHNFAYVIAASPLLIEKQLWFDEVYSMKPTGLGFSVSIRPKIYVKKYPERLFVSLYPQFSVMDRKLFTDVCLSMGYQRILFQRLVFNVEAGFGVRFYKDYYYEFQELETENTLYLPVSVNLGYLF